MQDAIGGYFQLELRSGAHYHDDALRLNTARNCFEYILLARKYRKVYIPYYTCEVMLQPLVRNRIDYEFYSINADFEPTEIKQLQEYEAYLYTNYYGLKQQCVERMAGIYGSRLIVDNAQAFYAPRVDGIDTFYSARKFFGVPDGAYLYTDCRLDLSLSRDKSYMRMGHLLQRVDDGAEAGYGAFRDSDDSLDNQTIKAMSLLTDAILRSIDYAEVARKRRANFRYMDERLGAGNAVRLFCDDTTVPMVYPYFTHDTSLRKRLIDRRVFVAKYWPNVAEWCSEDQIEYKMAESLVALPVDQRYAEKEMDTIINNI